MALTELANHSKTQCNQPRPRNRSIFFVLVKKESAIADFACRTRHIIPWTLNYRLYCSLIKVKKFNIRSITKNIKTMKVAIATGALKYGGGSGKKFIDG